MLYPQNGGRIVTIDSVTSIYTMYTRNLSYRGKHSRDIFRVRTIVLYTKVDDHSISVIN